MGDVCVGCVCVGDVCVGCVCVCVRGVCTGITVDDDLLGIKAGEVLGGRRVNMGNVTQPSEIGF